VSVWREQRRSLPRPGEEIKQLIAGNKPSRDLGDDTPPSRGSAVPKSGGRRKKGPEPEGGMEPQPSS
jgi:cell division protease FtsH